MQLSWSASRVSVAIVVAAVVIGCGSDPRADESEPDAADTTDGGSEDAAVDADTPDEMDAGREDGGDPPDDAEVPEGDAADDAAVDGSTPFEGTCVRWERDVDGDDEVDIAIKFFYDLDDRLVIEEHDTGSAAGVFDGADGTADYRQTTSYDDEGAIAAIADDWDADGNDDLITRYDADGRKVEEIWDVEDDGSVLDRTSYDYEEGELREKRRDSDGDGEADSATTYVYGDDGELLRIEEDQDLSDELVDKVSTFEYDGEGHRTQEEVYEGETPASRTVFVYEEGNLVRREEDEGIDAQLDVIEQWAFESGVLVSHEMDDDGDGLIEERQTFDVAGRVSSDEDYRDGMLDVSTTYEYDEDGNVLVERAEDGEATLLSLKQYEYDASSRLSQLTEDADGDGIDDVVTRWTYDTDDRLLTVEQKHGADPEAPFVVTEGYTYDAEGRLIESTFDSDADGTPDGSERRLYEC